MLTLKQRLQTVARATKTAITGRVSGIAPRIRYAAATTSRLMKGWDGYLQSIDDAVAFKLGTMRARARQLVEDNGEAAGLLLDFESDIVGPAGARLQFRATKPRGGPLDPLNDRIEGAFSIWGAKCTVDGIEDFASLQRLVIRTVIVDGEFFAIKHRGPQYPQGFALQPFDADLVDDTYNMPPNEAGVSIVMGVEIDRYGRRLFYHVWDRHPSSTNRGQRRAIPAADVVHVFKRVRVGQTRGITWFAPALVTWKMGDQYTESELVQSMLAAAQGGFFVNDDPSVGGTFPTRTVTDVHGNKQEVPIDLEVEPGISRALPPGWKFEAWSPTHPTANYVGFIKTAVKRVIARAFGRSQATLTGDLSDVNFSSIRTDRVREMEQNRMHQADILVRQFAQPVFADWIVMADLTGALGVLPKRPDELTRFATWMCRGWPWIDPLKDAAALQLEIQMRINSPQRACAERGRDFYEIVDECADADAYVKSKGLTMDAVMLALTIADPAEDSGTQNTDPARSLLRLTA